MTMPAPRLGDHTKAWAATVGGYDGFAFVTPEYNLFTDFENMTSFAPTPRHEPLVDAMFTQLESWANAMKTVRQPT